MKVKLRSIYAGPHGTAQPGQIIDLPDSEAAALVEGRYADPVETVRAETAMMDIVEDTALSVGRRGRK